MVELDLPVVGGDRGSWGTKVNGAFQALAGEVDTIPATVATAVSDEIDSRGIVESLDLVTRLKDSGRKIFMGHRGGARIHPEHILEGYRDCARSGFIPEVDIRRLASGELVACHDATTENTMTGAVANVADLTYDEWKARQVLSPWPGGKAGEPCTWDEILAEFGGRTVIMAEIKDGAALQDIIDSVTERGLHRQVILNSFTLAHVQATAAAGIASRYLTGSTTSVTPAQLVADGIEFLGPSKNMAPATVATYQAQGIKVLAYGWANDRAEWESLASTFDGAGFDDPWGMTGWYPKQTHDPFDTGEPFKGWTFRPSDASTDPSYIAINYATSRGKLFMDGIATAGGTYSMRQSWALPTDVPTGKVLRVRFRAGFDRESTDGTRWIGVFVGFTPDDAPFVGTAAVGQGGYHCLMRRGGGLEIFRVDSGVAATSIATAAGSGAVSVENQFHEYEYEVVVSNSNVTITRLDNGDSAQAASTTYRSNMSLHLTVNGMLGTFSDMSYQLLDNDTLEL